MASLYVTSNHTEARGQQKDFPLNNNTTPLSALLTTPGVQKKGKPSSAKATGDHHRGDRCLSFSAGSLLETDSTVSLRGSGHVAFPARAPTLLRGHRPRLATPGRARKCHCCLYGDARSYCCLRNGRRRPRWSSRNLSCWCGDGWQLERQRLLGRGAACCKPSAGRGPLRRRRCWGKQWAN